MCGQLNFKNQLFFLQAGQDERRQFNYCILYSDLFIFWGFFDDYVYVHTTFSEKAKLLGRNSTYNFQSQINLVFDKATILYEWNRHAHPKTSVKAKSSRLNLISAVNFESHSNTMRLTFEFSSVFHTTPYYLPIY